MVQERTSFLSGGGRSDFSSLVVPSPAQLELRTARETIRYPFNQILLLFNLLGAKEVLRFQEKPRWQSTVVDFEYV